MYQPSTSRYPIQLSVEYPEDGLDRLSTALRLFYAIPIVIVISLIFPAGYQFEGEIWPWSPGAWANYAAGAGGILVLPPMLMILFRRKYPRWWFDWNLEFLRFSNRVAAYLFLLRDEYPSTDEQQAVHLDIEYPDAEEDLNRWFPLVKWLLAIPHYIVLFFLALGAFFAVIVAWFAILVTGKYPREIFDFIVALLRWEARVVGYSAILVTDRYPPFSLDG